ncbi:putative nudix family [Phaeomoniella chlamydospora]|uniref:Putative nudix family n=1 Tax=Phaeomoniella chlamydospora TaxID=158046 RepID=A0A0G2HJB8_PHACM|nr:putative nudix family [Phaeomoniella chlamydospora]
MADAFDRFKYLSDKLGKVLFDLKQNPSPHVPNPAGSKKRASVALVIRVRPAHNEVIESLESIPSDKVNLDAFFSQDWVKSGSPEVLFIKRIDRSGDRWSGHVALPGGRRDPEDEDDLGTAVRETWEEVGLKLDSKDCITISNLPERIISTTWGHQVLMVICPYVFLWTSPKSPTLQLQPCEIASAHWIPLATLLSPALRTQQLADFSDRLMHRRGPLVRYLSRSLIGKMSFSAIRLIPNESYYATILTDIVAPPTSRIRSILSWMIPVANAKSLPPAPPPLQLWGLTLGILADFLDQFPPYDAVKLWTYPTFTPPDLQLIIYLSTLSKRQANARTLNDGARTPQSIAQSTVTPTSSTRRGSSGQSNNTAIDNTTAAVAVDQPFAPTSNTVSSSTAKSSTHAVGTLLDGYYDRMKIAIGIFLVWRLGLGIAFSIWVARHVRVGWKVKVSR